MRLLAVFATDRTLSGHCGLKSLAKDWLRCSLSKSKCPSPALSNCEGALQGSVGDFDGAAAHDFSSR